MHYPSTCRNTGTQTYTHPFRRTYAHARSQTLLQTPLPPDIFGLAPEKDNEKKHIRLCQVSAESIFSDKLLVVAVQQSNSPASQNMYCTVCSCLFLPLLVRRQLPFYLLSPIFCFITVVYLNICIFIRSNLNKTARGDGIILHYETSSGSDTFHIVTFVICKLKYFSLNCFCSNCL